ncbi:MAG: hypothetical protein HY313_08540 [Acidobacteria bacterium]|nr:hypothetical protein [Acidobacteriota bacterium]
MQQLFSRENLCEFVSWSLEVRKVKSLTLNVWLGILHASLRRYPPLKREDLDYLAALILDLPKDLQAIKNAKRHKWVKYDVLDAVPELIQKEIETGKVSGTKNVALATQSALLMRWLTLLPWRQRNLRECKLGSRDEGGNLFKAEIPDFETVDVPPWAEVASRLNPKEKFWQFDFRPGETKTGIEVNGFVPQELVPLLEDFLNYHRSRLVQGDDPGTLFLNSEGRPFSASGLNSLVGDLTIRYCGKRVNVHLCRDIFAVEWLKETRDYLTLSKLLWHANVKTTLGTYGAFFDESYGISKLEEWREKRKKSKPPE